MPKQLDQLLNSTGPIFFSPQFHKLGRVKTTTQSWLYVKYFSHQNGIMKFVFVI